MYLWLVLNLTVLVYSGYDEQFYDSCTYRRVVVLILLVLLAVLVDEASLVVVVVIMFIVPIGMEWYVVLLVIEN